MKSSTYHFHTKTKTLADFQICISVPLKERLVSQLQLEERRRLVESGENNAEAQLEEQYRTGTEPIRQVTEQHVAENGVEQRER